MASEPSAPPPNRNEGSHLAPASVVSRRSREVLAEANVVTSHMCCSHIQNGISRGLQLHITSMNSTGHHPHSMLRIFNSENRLTCCVISVRAIWNRVEGGYEATLPGGRNSSKTRDFASSLTCGTTSHTNHYYKGSRSKNGIALKQTAVLIHAYMGM